MELKYQAILYIGIVVIVILAALTFVRKSGYKDGKKISSMYGVEQSAYFQKKMRIYKVMRGIMAVTLLAAILLSFILLARPYTISKEKQDEYKRDIILCMDISSSVDELNKSLVGRLQDTVSQLKGERFGIVIFNTSGVMICPLTDDYEYVQQILDEIKNSIGAASDMDSDLDLEWMYKMHYLLDGTLVGNEERGSSLIGDGLATAACDFPDLGEDRTRIVILSTDNDLAGTPVFTMDAAADLCVDKKVTVYGIGTNNMSDDNMENMKSAVNKTGGKFYVQEESGTMDGIVDDISKQAKSLVKGKAITKEIPLVKVPVIMLAICFVMQLAASKILKM